MISYVCTSGSQFSSRCDGGNELEPDTWRGGEGGGGAGSGRLPGQKTTVPPPLIDQEEPEEPVTGYHGTSSLKQSQVTNTKQSSLSIRPSGVGGGGELGSKELKWENLHSTRLM